MTPSEYKKFKDVRDFILKNRNDAKELSTVCFPVIDNFNWASDWFDVYARGNGNTCLEGPTLPHEWASLSYEEVSIRSSEIANDLQQKGMLCGDKVIVEAPSSIEVYLVILAALKIGVVIIPIHFGLDSLAFEDRIVVASPEWIITDRNLSCHTTTAKILPLFKLFSETNRGRNYVRSFRSSNLPAYGCFTSGTTGRPKLVLHSQQTHGIAHLSSLAWNDIDPEGRHLNISSPGWAKFFWSSLLVPLTAGATVVIKPDDLSATDLIHFCNTHSVSSLCAPVPFLTKALSDSSEEPSSLLDITTVGEAVPEQLKSDCQERWDLYIRTGYGQSEATGIMGELKSRLGVLSVLPGYKVRVKSYPNEAAGRLEYKSFSNGSFNGYIKENGLESPTLNAEGWQWSGDYASGTPGEKDFKILGRGDDVFRVNGHIVSPSEIEHVLCRHSKVLSAAVFPHPDCQGLLQARAHIVLSESDKHLNSASEIHSWINHQLPDDVNISQLTVVDNIPMSINGKIQRKLIAANYQT